MSKLSYTKLMKPEEISVDKIWTLFKIAVIPKDASTLQVLEMKKSFFAGFIECFKVMSDVSTDLDEKDACGVLSRINLEAHEFFEQMMREAGLGHHLQPQ